MSRITKIIGFIGLLGFYSSALLAGDIGVEGSVSATTFVGDGSGLTGVVTTEVDPQVGLVTTSRWCIGDGTAVQCNQIAPVTTEVDPVVDGLSADKWCKADATASVINCDQEAPIQAPAGASVGDMQYWDGTAWVLIPAPTGDANMLSMCSGNLIWTAGGCYAIGNRGPAGGIVFHITDGGAHGLEAAPEDHGSLVEWGCNGTFITGADGTLVGTGAQNTADILAGCATPVIAARVADEYTLNGFTDWFLPSIDELDLLYGQKAVVGGFAGNYWSSSEYDGNLALIQSTDEGYQHTHLKSFPLGVRPVRAF